MLGMDLGHGHVPGLQAGFGTAEPPWLASQGHSCSCSSCIWHGACVYAPVAGRTAIGSWLLQLQEPGRAAGEVALLDGSLFAYPPVRVSACPETCGCIGIYPAKLIRPTDLTMDVHSMK